MGGHKLRLNQIFHDFSLIWMFCWFVCHSFATFGHVQVWVLNITIVYEYRGWQMIIWNQQLLEVNQNKTLYIIFKKKKKQIKTAIFRDSMKKEKGQRMTVIFRGFMEKKSRERLQFLETIKNSRERVQFLETL